MTAPDTCETCAEYENLIQFIKQFDYRRKMELWAEYEKHRREAHHVLHLATAAPKLPLDKRGRKS